MLLLLLAACGNDISVSKQRIDSDGDGYAIEVDCDDAHVTVNPDATEICDGLDNDCDGAVDDAAADASIWYTDADGDTFGDEPVAACEAPEGAVDRDGDCDDGGAAVYPGADEVCDGVDQDCDGEVDEDAIDAAAWYVDADGDGFGDGAAAYGCDGGEGLVEAEGDCDDADETIHPGAAEDCAVPVDANCDGSVGYADADADGVAACEECDDADGGVYPGASEVCDGVDQDCDGAVDEDVEQTFYGDADGDGYGDAAVVTDACDAPVGYVTDATDCDDGDVSIYPAAPEACDGLDHDCDGAADEAGSADAATWYADADGDGHGDSAVSVDACDAPVGYVANMDDCDDADAATFPGATEMCDGVDQDCDGVTDDGAVDAEIWYADADADTHGDAARAVSSCDAPVGYVPSATDCDDATGAVHPGAVEVCDGVDQDCDGDVDEDAADAPIWYADDDGDMHGTDAMVVATCAAPTGFVAGDDDCDDAEPDVYPGAPEWCDGVDHDCDGAVDEDEAVDALAWYADVDGDTFGDAASVAIACDVPVGYGGDASDCDDDSAATHPGAVEVCDTANTDEDCDGAADDLDTAPVGRGTWYRDADGDTFGGSTTVAACDLPVGFVATSTDCDDTSVVVSPAGSEVCDAANVDEDCDGAADDLDTSASGETTWYLDADGDGYAGTATASACDRPSGYLAVTTDCDDAESDAYPGGVEVCGDGIDQDCSGTDASCPLSGTYDPDDDYDVKIYGEGVGDAFGHTVVTGDFNGDGDSDLVVGAAQEFYSSSASHGGVVYGYYGPFTGGVSSAYDTDDFLKWSAQAGVASYGERLYNLGDLTDDGKDDLAIGYGTVVSVFYGGDTGAASYSTHDGYFGCATADAAGNVEDVAGSVNWVCGYPTYASSLGLAYVYRDTGTTAQATLYGEYSGDGAGSAVASGGDVDGDGIDDVWVGAHLNDTGGTYAGALYLVYGPVSGSTYLSGADEKLIGDSSSDYLGYRAVMPGDVDGDGADDIVVAAYRADFGSRRQAGELYVITTPASGTVSSAAHATISGPTAYTYLGYTGAPAVGDIDGDGELDLLAGSSLEGSNWNGAAWLVYGPLAGSIDLETDASATWSGANDSDGLGDVAVLPDSDGDGRDEIVLGAAEGDHGSYTDYGAVWIWYGS